MREREGGGVRERGRIEEREGVREKGGRKRRERRVVGGGNTKRITHIVLIVFHHLRHKSPLIWYR